VRKKRVLYIIENLSRGGAERVVVDLAQNIDRRRFEPYVCCLREEGVLAAELKSAGVPVFALHKRRAIDLLMLRRLRRKIREIGADIVHTHLFTANTWGRIAARLAGVPRIIASEHSADAGRDRVRLLVDRVLAKYSDAIIAKADAVAEFCRRRIGVNGEKVHVVPNGVDLSKFGTASRFDVRAEMNVSEDAILVAAVGRLAPEKDYSNLINAAAAASSEVENLALWIIGSGPLERRLKDEADERGLDGIVDFLGGRDDVPRLLAAPDIFVLSSKREGMPLSLLEAMASGMAVVATDAGGCGEVVENGYNGLLVPPESAEALSKAIVELARDPHARARLGRNALQTVRVYDMENTVGRIERIYLGNDE